VVFERTNNMVEKISLLSGRKDALETIVPKLAAWVCFLLKAQDSSFCSSDREE